MSKRDLRIKPDGRSVVTYETTSVEIFMDEDTNTGRLSNLYSVNRGQGYASGLLKTICDWADENDVYLWCVARPYGTPHNTLTQDQLEKFYEKFGFVKKRKDRKIEMHRKPKSMGFVW